jgi:hypothetical protein
VLASRSEPSHVIDVVGAFGADPTGQHDSTSALQSALTAAAAATGRARVWVPKVSYTIIAKLILPAAVGPIWIEGKGPGRSTIRMSDAVEWTPSLPRNSSEKGRWPRESSSTRHGLLREPRVQPAAQGVRKRRADAGPKQQLEPERREPTHRRPSGRHQRPLDRMGYWAGIDPRDITPVDETAHPAGSKFKPASGTRMQEAEHSIHAVDESTGEAACGTVEVATLTRLPRSWNLWTPLAKCRACHAAAPVSDGRQDA